MKIGLDTTTLTPRITGTNRYLTCLIKELESFDFQLKKYSTGSKLFSDGKHYSSLNRHTYRLFGQAKEMNNDNLDLAIFPNYLIPPFYNKSSVIVIHDLSFITHPEFYSKLFVRFYTNQLRQTLKKKPIITAVSNFTSSQINEYLNIPLKDVHLLQAYNNRDSKFLDIKKENYFLYVGHIEPRKNIGGMIESFLKWRDENNIDIKLKIVGEVWIKNEQISDLIEQHKENEFIEFMGYVNEDELNLLYNKALGLIHLSYVEGFGFPVLEAMHYKLPILCSDNTATAELTGGNAVYADVRSQDSIYKGIDELYNYANNNIINNYKIEYSKDNTQKQIKKVLDIANQKNNYSVDIAIPKSLSIEESIQKTLVYSALFSSGVKKDYLKKFLQDNEISDNELELTTGLLEKQNVITKKNDAFFINKSIEPLYSGTKKSLGEKRYKQLLKIIDRTPFISLAAFSGGSAHSDYGDHDDLDLFVITKPYTLYISYMFMHLYSKMIKARNELCINYLIDETDLLISKQQDFYTAHQIVSLSAYKNDNMLNTFLSKNNWIKKYFPNVDIKNSKSDKSKMTYLLRPVNYILYLLYRVYYIRILKKYKNSSACILKENCIKLHTQDNRQLIHETFSKVWKEYLSKLQRKKIPA